MAQLAAELAAMPSAGPRAPTGRLREAVAALKRERDDLAEVADALAYALRYDGNRRVYHADEVMARITAERLISATWSARGSS